MGAGAELCIDGTEETMAWPDLLRLLGMVVVLLGVDLVGQRGNGRESHASAV